MKKRVLSILLCLCMVLALFPVTALAEEGKTVSFTVTADKTEAQPGDTITFTLTMGAVDGLGGLCLNLRIPEGLTYVEDSGTVAEGLKETMSATSITLNSFLLFWITKCNYTSIADTVLMTFQCTVNDDAAPGAKTVGVGLFEDYEGYCFDVDQDRIAATFNPVTVTVSEASAPARAITFNANGGSGSMDAVTGVSGSYTLPTCTFTAPSGKQFKGWATSATGEVISGTSITVTGNTTLYAIWEDIPATTYTITFDPNGGTLTGSETTKTEADGTVDYLSAATRDGYTFDGWYTEKTGGEKVYTYITQFTADTTVYAHWTPAADTSQITEASFAMKGYAVGANAEDIVITSNTEGLSLVGGYFEALGQPYSYLIAVVSGEDYDPVTGPLEANKTYILMLKAGVNAGYDGSGLIKDHVTLNGDIEAEECAVNKWEASIGCSFVLPVLTGNDSPDAKYTITFDPNGGSGSMDAVTGVSGSYTLPACGFTAPSGQQFKGWATSASGEVISGTSITVTESITLYAIWEDIPAATEYSITVTDGKATVGAGTEISKAAEGTTVTLTANAAPDGKVFDKWVVESGSITLADENSATTTFTMPAGAVSVKAAYKDASHTHSYGSDWKSDADKHWHECSCGDKSDVAAHSFKWVVDKEATATKKGSKHEECAVCGYQRPAVEIPATGSTTKPTTHTLDDVPKTGDNSNMILWIVLLLASGLGVTGAVVYSKRKKYVK